MLTLIRRWREAVGQFEPVLIKGTDPFHANVYFRAPVGKPKGVSVPSPALVIFLCFMRDAWAIR